MLPLNFREYRDEAMLNNPPNIQLHEKYTNQPVKTGAQIVITQKSFKSPGPIRPLKIIWAAIIRKVVRPTQIRAPESKDFRLARIENIAKKARLLFLIIRFLISLHEIRSAEMR